MGYVYCICFSKHGRKWSKILSPPKPLAMAGPDVDARFAEAGIEVDGEGEKGGTSEGVVPRESGCLIFDEIVHKNSVFHVFWNNFLDEGTFGRDCESELLANLFPFCFVFLPLCWSNKPSKTVTLWPFSPRYSYSHFVERFKHPSAQAVVNEIRDFVNEFPANLTRLQAARRIHHFLGQVTPKLLQVGGEMEMEIRSVDIICVFF